MGKKVLAMFLVLVMVLPFTACAAELSAQEIVDGAVEAVDDNIRTYEFEMDMSLEAAGVVEGEAVEATMEMDFSGALDLDNREMRMDIDMNMAVTGEGETEMALEMYLVDNMGYVMIDMPEMEPVWEKEEFSEADWEEMLTVLSLSEPQIELLEAAQVEVIGSEKVKGVDCYVLQLTPDLEQLWGTVMQQASLGGEGMELPEVAEEIIDEVFRSFSVKQWVAKDTYFLTKVEIDMSMEFTPETMELMGEEGEMTMDIAMSFLVYNYNQPVSIELPPEALGL